MALQIRNCVFDPSVAARITELSAILGNATAVGATKKEPLAKSSQGRYVYEIACVGLMIHLEVSKDASPASIASLEAAIVVAVTANGLVSITNGWEIGHDNDLRVG